VIMLFGQTLRHAKNAWLYPIEKQQGFWRALGFTVLLFLILQILQVALGYAIFVFGFGQPLSNLVPPSPEAISSFTKAAVIAMFPAAIPVLFLALYVMKFGLPQRQGSLPLNWPSLGFIGWLILILLFIIAMALAMNGAYWVTGFDPKQGSGVIEKAMAELTANPMVFSLSLPSIILAAPLAEEFLFRGILFAGLTNTPVGRTGAVLITAGLWALAHAFGAPWINVGVLFIMGVVLGLLLLRFGSLWVPIVLHTAWNTMTSLAIFAVGTQT
jgi:uncharacterized protein